MRNYVNLHVFYMIFNFLFPISALMALKVVPLKPSDSHINDLAANFLLNLSKHYDLDHIV